MLGIFKPAFLRWVGRFFLFAVGYSVAFILFFSTLRFTWPYLLALLIAWTLRPLMRFLIRRLHWKPNVASICGLVLVVLVSVGVVSVIVWRLVVELIGIIEQVSKVDFVAAFNAVQNFLAELQLPITGEAPILDFANQYREQINTALSSLTSKVSDMMGSIGSGLLSGVASLPAAIMSFVVTFFAIYYFGRDWESQSGWKEIFQQKVISQAQGFYQESVRLAGRYFSAYFKLILITFAQTLLLFFILDVPYALLFAVLAGIFDIMPAIGVSLVYIPMMVYFALQGAWIQVLGLLVGLVVVTLVHQILEPRFVSKSIDIHPLLMIGIFLLALQLGNLWVMVYLMLFAIVYKIMGRAGIFDKEEGSNGDGDSTTKQGENAIK